MTDMNLGMTERLKPILKKVARMVREEIIPLDEEFLAEVGRNGDRWTYTPRQTEILEGLKKENKHLALDDIRESITELQYYREHFIDA